MANEYFATTFWGTGFWVSGYWGGAAAPLPFAQSLYTLSMGAEPRTLSVEPREARVLKVAAEDRTTIVRSDIP